jgi:hypothetical protein
VILYLIVPAAAAHEGHASLHINWGDVPTWLLFIGAVAAGIAAFRQLAVMQDDSRKRTAQLERAQADQVDVVLERSLKALPGEEPPAGLREAHWFVIVRNESRRPIRDVSCVMAPEVGALQQAAVRSGHTIRTPGLAGTVFRAADTLIAAVLRPGKTWELLFNVKSEEQPQPEFTVRFTDDSGLHWSIDQDLRLRPERQQRHRWWRRGR